MLSNLGEAAMMLVPRLLPLALLTASATLALSATAYAQHVHRGHAHGHEHDAEPKRPAKTQMQRSPVASKPQGRPVAQNTVAHGHSHAGHSHEGHGPETENLFGFVLGSDVEPAGARAVALESVWRFGKRAGTYVGVGQKLEFAYGLTDDLSIAAALLGSYHRVRSVPGFDDVERLRANGIGGEVRWRLSNRKTNGFGLTLHIEPSWSVSDELTGLSGRRLASENKIILDTELVRDRLYAAFNIINEMEVVKEQGAPDTERVSKIGFGLALSTPIAKNVFLGAETRYLRAYEGLSFEQATGYALYVGPTLHARFENNTWISLAWNMQVTGREKGNPALFDLTNFERQHVRLKAGIDF
jgi:hypothetical protein